jgi:RNA 2',3'-cyclic 3'-phosphodiesterase
LALKVVVANPRRGDFSWPPFEHLNILFARPALAIAQENQERMAGFDPPRYTAQVMARLFVALDLPLACRENLEQLAYEMRGARWLDADGIHLTLAFLGEVASHRRQPLSESLEAIDSRSFSIDLDGIGFFPSRGEPTTLWVGCRRCEELASLKRRVDRALLEGGFSTVRQRFRPHVTIARLKSCHHRDLSAFLQEFSMIEMAGVPISSFSLYSSQLRPKGARYLREETHPLLPEVAE